MRVDVSGHQFTFPLGCACCNGIADAQLTVSASKSTGKRVVHTKTQAWDFQYCSRCLSHVRAVGQAASTAKALTFLSLVAAIVLGYVTEPVIGIILGILGIAVIIAVHKNQMDKARAMCSSTCASVRPAVAYLGWYGTLHRFEIGSVDFAREFIVTNQRKLVNLSPQAQNLLASSGAAPSTNAPRSARRYMS